MMLFAGLLILMGIAIDILLNGFAVLHIMLGCCGLAIVLINIAGEKFLKGRLYTGGIIGKNILSFAAVILAGIVVFGFFSSERLQPEKKDVRSILQKSGKINKNEGPEKAMAFHERKALGQGCGFCRRKTA